MPPTDANPTATQPPTNATTLTQPPTNATNPTATQPPPPVQPDVMTQQSLLSQVIYFSLPKKRKILPVLIVEFVLSAGGDYNLCGSIVLVRDYTDTTTSWFNTNSTYSTYKDCQHQIWLNTDSTYKDCQHKIC